MKLTPWSDQNVVEKAQLAVSVYMLSIFQLDTLLAEHAGKVRCVLVVSFPQIDSYVILPLWELQPSHKTRAAMHTKGLG